MIQNGLFDAADATAGPAAVPRCPACNGESFAPITGGTGRMRCLKCGWMIVVAPNGQTVDALDWTRAGRGIGSRRSTETRRKAGP